jgi:DNA-binding ferritin-like protein
MEFVGRIGSDILLQSEDIAVIVNEDSNTVSQTGTLASLREIGPWDPDGTEPSAVSIELASAAVTSLDIKVLSNNSRMYTIPKAVQAEAERALAWYGEHARGGTPVGLTVAKMLANGGQVDLNKIKHVANYFPHHFSDVGSLGYRVNDEGYPSAKRIGWGLWGGSAAERWTYTIMEKEEQTLSPYDAPETIELSSFNASDEEDFSQTEFYIRLFTDGSGFDRLYKREADESLSVWDDGAWYDLGETHTSFSKLDSNLDTDAPTVQHFHTLVDAETALIASAYLDGDSSGTVLLSTLDATEAELAADALSDPTFFADIDSITAASTPPPAPAPTGDGVYTPAEHSANAKKQARDATGRFAQEGSRVIIGNDRAASGTITSINGDSAQVKMDNGQVANVPVNQTRDEKSVGILPGNPIGNRLDTSGILGEPRDVLNAPSAMLSGRLPALTPANLLTMLSDWPRWVADQRAAFTPNAPIPQVHVDGPEDYLKAPNAYNDRRLRDWLDKTVKGKDGKTSHPNQHWYQPLKSSWPSVDAKKPRNKVYSADTLTAAGTPPQELTPTTSDVPPIYMAIVDKDDPQAVMDLISLIPTDSKGTSPAVFKYEGGKWEKNEQILADLNSPTPPPVVVLDGTELSSVVKQIMASEDAEKTADEAPAPDAAVTPAAQPPQPPQPPQALSVDGLLALMLSYEDSAILAGGGLDRNRGGAEKLRRYWTVGRGAAKIRWNTGGDWTRCVRHLSKYLGPRAKGYCALRHKEMTGLWTGDKTHRKMYGHKGNKAFAMTDDLLLSSEAVIDAAVLRAQVADLKSRVLIASGGFQAPAEDGAKFLIPLVLPEGIETGDGRKFSAGAITMREFPLPLMWQIKTAEGHNGSVVVGRIDHMERIDGGVGNAYGVFDAGQYGKEAERLVRGGFIRGISADLDRFEAAEEPEEAAAKDKKKMGGNKLTISKGRIMGVTLVPKPAFQECTIQLAEESDSVGMQNSEKDALVACASVVASIPVVPPKSWFTDPKLSGPTPLSVSDDGHVFGHIAAWHVDHIGLSFGTKPPRSRSGYAYFHTGVIRTDDGSDVPIGQLTLAGGHASLSADASAAAKHYDDTASAFADVHAGEDTYGIWVSGALRPSVSPEQVRAIRASAPSGDWRPIQGALELVAVCQVNVPGFPIARARVASGQVYALVAAGANYLARIKADPSVAQAAEDIKARFAAIRGEMEAKTITAGVGMDMQQEPPTVEVLERLLADVVTFYFRAQGFHWNVTGDDFAEYHKLFGDIYGDVYGSIDDIAENVRKLGGFPPFELQDYISHSSLPKVAVQGGNAKSLAADLLLANEVLIEEIKAAYTVFNQMNEQGICNFLAGRLDMHQKWAWQLASSISSTDIIISEDESRDEAFAEVFADMAKQGLITTEQAARSPKAQTPESMDLAVQVANLRARISAKSLTAAAPLVEADPKA